MALLPSVRYQKGRCPRSTFLPLRSVTPPQETLSLFGWYGRGLGVCRITRCIKGRDLLGSHHYPPIPILTHELLGPLQPLHTTRAVDGERYVYSCRIILWLHRRKRVVRY